MGIKIRKSAERGESKLDWLKSRHGFSFGRYNNLDNINFGNLIVFNEDIIAGGKGLGAHPHENAEIITIVLEGSLKHEDSEGNRGIIEYGEVQRMSAGRGIWHSEFNNSRERNLHLLQIWIEPNEINLEPSYEQKKLKINKNEFNRIVSNNKNNECVYIHQETEFFLGYFSELEEKEHHIGKEKKVYLFLINGEILLNGLGMTDGDSAEIEESDKIVIECKKESRFLLIEMNN